MYVCEVCRDWSIHSILDYSLGQLFKLSIEAGHMCLSKWAETSVALAALELMGGLAQLQIEDASECPFSLSLSLSLSLSPPLSPYLLTCVFTKTHEYLHSMRVYQWVIDTQEMPICS